MSLKKLIFVVLMSLSFAVYGEIVSSSIEGIVTYLPEKGKLIKKGEVLAKFDDEGIGYDIREKELEVKYAEKELEDAATDIERYRKLIKANAVSTADLEDVQVAYHNAVINLEKLKIELDKLKSDKSDYVIFAPYDCRVSKIIIVTNSGREIGDEILEVERLSIN